MDTEGEEGVLTMGGAGEGRSHDGLLGCCGILTMDGAVLMEG